MQNIYVGTFLRNEVTVFRKNLHQLLVIDRNTHVVIIRHCGLVFSRRRICSKINQYYVFLQILGSVIRCMRRLDELARQMSQAAKAIGNTELENKFSEGIRKIKRDIVFAASLYL